MKTWILVLLLPGLLGCPAEAPQSQPPQESQTFSRQLYLMGTLCSLTAKGRDRTSELGRLERFVEVLEDAESELSTWRDDSPWSRFNVAPVGEAKSLSPAMCRLFTQLFQWSLETGGAFDPAIGPLIDAWDIRGGGRVPEADELKAALGRAGLAGIGFSAKRCTAFRRSDTWIDSGAFGKGEALDRIRESPAAGSGPWFIDLGGQVAASEVPAGELGWSVELADPKRRDRPVLTILLTGGSLATSGGSERDLNIGGTRVGHILDPRTGRPATFGGSVTVWHQSGLVADILSTALYVMGPEKGIPWAESREVAVLFLDTSEQEPAVVSKASSRFQRMFPMTRR